MSNYVRVIVCINIAVNFAVTFGFVVLAAGGDTGNAIAGSLIGFLFGGLAAVLTTEN